MPVGATTPIVLPFSGLTVPSGVAVDNAGNVYVVDNRRVLKLAAASGTLTALPFAGFKAAQGVAVDAAGAANSPSRMRPGDAYAAQMTRSRPESTGGDRK